MEDRLKSLLIRGNIYFEKAGTEELEMKQHSEKWSKKEILGHLIDSAINNIKRFTEVQFEPKPFRIHRYNQNELVKANNYQGADKNHLIEMWHSLNRHIFYLIQLQTPETLDYEIILEDGRVYDLNYLIDDYISHLEHHLNQIMEVC